MANADSTGRRNTTLPAHLLSHWQELFRRGNIRDCENDARKLINDFPQAGKAWQLLGASLLADGRPDEALPALRRASALAPADWSIWDNLALPCNGRDFAGASETYRTGHWTVRPAKLACGQRGRQRTGVGRPPTALIPGVEAIRLAPNLAVAHLNVGNALSASGQSAEAEAAFLQALSIQPDYVQALLSLGREQSQRGQIADAIDTTRRALAIKPDYADAHVNLGHGLNTLGDVALAAEHYLRALALKPELTSAGSGALYCMLHDDRQSPEDVAAAHRKFGEQLEAPREVHWKRHANGADPERRLRLGFVSPDLRNHPVARFLEPIWRALDRDRLELFAYDVQPARDDIAMRLRELADHWTIAASMPDAQLDACIRRDGIDILFDLSGHTARNRMGLFARKPARCRFPGSAIRARPACARWTTVSSTRSSPRRDDSSICSPNAWHICPTCRYSTVRRTFPQCSHRHSPRASG
jgi:tetratricopeptide (TPR) repeat protein